MGNKASASPRTYLTERELVFLENNTRFNRDKILAWHAAFLTDCPDGKLDKKKFVKLYQELEPAETKVDRYAEYVFKAFDLDNSGFIDFAEFLLAFNMRSKNNLESRLTWTFNIYDTDSNGQIDSKELRKMFDLLFTMLNVDKKSDKYNVDKYVSSVIERFDLSGDRKLSLEEFVQGVKNDESLKKLILEHEID